MNGSAADGMLAARGPLEHRIRLTIGARQDAERAAAREVVELVRNRAARGERCALGLATGGTMVGVYREIVRLAVESGASFQGASTVNLDEYVGLAPGDERSFARFMERHLFGPLAEAGLAPARTFVPDGTRAARDPRGAARAVEDHLAALGGIDLQLLGIGRNGHLAFNEPGSPHASRTRVVELAQETREDAKASFGSAEAVPERALTLGLATILEARRLRVLAFGEAKAAAVAASLEGPIGEASPASALRRHPDVHLRLDPAAASRLASRPAEHGR